MSLASPFTPANPDDVAQFQAAYQSWSSGNQQMAFDQLRPLAESGRPWAAALLSWLLMQNGFPSLDESVTWAVKAAQAGLASQLTNVFNNVVANLSSYPQLAERLPELIDMGLPWTAGPDFVAQAWNLMAQGQSEIAMQVISMPHPGPDPGLKALFDRANSRVNDIEQAAATVHRQAEDIDAAASSAGAAIEQAKSGLETRAKQAGLLVTTVSSDATNSLFKEDAARNAKESWVAWRMGLLVLGVAAIVAVLPVLLHYLHLGPDYTSIEQIGLHLVSTAALGTFAGVLLARARSRDQAAQRAHDLSTAMGTMITYSNQISDPAER